ncbi:MAG: periplasmic-type flagellar collar protein FlbB [Spirochaetota bacterium]
MNATATVTTLLKILFLILLILVIILGGIYWFDHLGLINYKNIVGPFSRYLPGFMKKGQVVEEEPSLLEKEFLEKREQLLADRSQDLEELQKKLEKKELELNEMETRLKEEKRALEESKKVLSEKMREYDNYKENISKQARYFISMPPEDAVERLARMDDLLVIDIFRQMDKIAEEEGRVSMAPYYLSLMDPEKAAVIQRKMTKVTERQ